MLSSARASISLTAFSMGQVPTSLTVSNRSLILLHVWSLQLANTIRSRLQYDGTSTGSQFSIVFSSSSTSSRATAWLHGRAPEYLIELCHSMNEIPERRNHRSSSQVQLLVPRYRKERSGHRGFSVSSPQLWNLLIANIRLLHNEHQLFRKRLKTSAHFRALYLSFFLSFYLFIFFPFFILLEALWVPGGPKLQLT